MSDGLRVNGSRCNVKKPTFFVIAVTFLFYFLPLGSISTVFKMAYPKWWLCRTNYAIPTSCDVIVSLCRKENSFGRTIYPLGFIIIALMLKKFLASTAIYIALLSNRFLFRAYRPRPANYRGKRYTSLRFVSFAIRGTNCIICCYQLKINSAFLIISSALL